MELPTPKSIIVSIDLNLSFDEILSNLKLNNYGASALNLALEMEQQGLKRKPVEIALRRALLGNGLDKQKILSSIKAAETRRRKRIVRKIYTNTTIWAMEEIRKIYPHYTYDMLAKDLKVTKKKKPKQTRGYRHNQIRSLYHRIREDKYEGDMINKYAHLLVRHCDNYNKPVVMDVVRDNKVVSFLFPPTIDESKLKSFIIAVNTGEPLEDLQQRYIDVRYNTSGLNK